MNVAEELLEGETLADRLARDCRVRVPEIERTSFAACMNARVHGSRASLRRCGSRLLARLLRRGALEKC